MRKLLLLPVLALLAGCHHDAADLAPLARGNDALAMADGHWEWERSTVGFSGSQTPATVGYTRQLVFTPDGRVFIGHNGRIVTTTTYELSMGTLAGCSAGLPNAPIITFVNEDGIKAGPRKAYQVTTQGSTMALNLTGDYACVDAGAYESFHWVAE